MPNKIEKEENTCSVKERIMQIKQPAGGYLPLAKFTKMVAEPRPTKEKTENVPIWVVNEAIEFLMRPKIVKIVTRTADETLDKIPEKEHPEMIIFRKLKEYASQVNPDFTDSAITAAYKLVMLFESLPEDPFATLEQIKDLEFNKTSINYARGFFRAAGLVTMANFINEDSFTKYITNDDEKPDKFLTNEAFWLTIATENEPLDEKVTLRLLVQYLMGLHSINDEEFEKVKYLGIYDFTTNTSYLIGISQIDLQVVKDVANKVIGYNNKNNLLKNQNGTTGVSIIERLKQVEQPKDGFLPINTFTTKQLKFDNDTLAKENINPIIINTAVKYLVRLQAAGEINKFFVYAKIAATDQDKNNKVEDLIKHIYPGLTNLSIVSMIKIMPYYLYTALDAAEYNKLLPQLSVDNISQDTINDIRIMTKRTLNLFVKYPALVGIDLDFLKEFTNKINSGTCDYLTDQAVWLVLTDKTETISPKVTLHALINYLMGLHAKWHDDFAKVKFLGIYNARTDTVYQLKVSDIDPKVIKTVNTKVIGYDK